MDISLIFLCDVELLEYFELNEIPFPFSLSFLRKDRALFNRKKCIRIPCRKIGGRYLYNPEEVLQFIKKIPVVMEEWPNSSSHLSSSSRGRPNKCESIKAKNLGISVTELRRKNGMFLSSL